jgi:hypothetical protein
VRSARERLALSAPRVSLEGSVRQPAAVLLDVMRALQGSNHSERLEQQLEAAASVGRAHERRSRERHPLTPSARLERIAHGDAALAHDECKPALALESLRARDRKRPNMQGGLLRGVLPHEVLPGLTRSPDRNDCTFCPFQPVCEPDLERVASVLEDPRVPRRLKLLKLEADS